MKSKITIVFIDDDSTICKLVGKYLNSYNVITFDNPKRGFRYIKKELPHIVILDIHMPNMTGLDILRNIKSNTDICHIPVVILTGDDSDITKEKTIAEYAESYILKPFTKDRLEEVLSVVIRNKNIKEDTK